MKVCFETFGCRLNKAEALQMEAEYLANGWEVTDTRKEADLFVVRGCSVTRRAQEDCEKLVAHLRKTYLKATVRVCGCLKDPSPVPLRQQLVALRPTASDSVPTPTRTARAYLKVQDGCSGHCTFCIVPQFRGKSVSTDFTAVLDQAKRFIDVGYHEIVVTGCNLSLYASQDKRLPELLDALAGLSADCRIRLGSLEPGACALDAVHAIAARANICKFLHIPVQSASLRVLKGMQRPYAPQDLETLIETATDLLPALGLGCDLMTGFPGEEEVDFSVTKGFLKRHPFNNAHVFPFSSRPHTIAAGLPLQVPHHIRSDRARELSDLMKTKRTAFAKSFVGKTVAIVVEHDRKCSGWTGEYLKCEAVGTAPRKSLVRILVTQAKGDRLVGKLADK